MPHNPAAAEFAASVRSLLNEDIRRYRCFGAYWYFVKALLRRFYDRHEMPILGSYDDRSVSDRIPDTARGGLADMMAAAAEEYEGNASFLLGVNKITDDSGEEFILFDPDVGI